MSTKCPLILKRNGGNLQTKTCNAMIVCDPDMESNIAKIDTGKSCRRKPEKALWLRDATTRWLPYWKPFLDLNRNRFLRGGLRNIIHICIGI